MLVRDGFWKIFGGSLCLRVEVWVLCRVEKFSWVVFLFFFSAGKFGEAVVFCVGCIVWRLLLSGVFLHQCGVDHMSTHSSFWDVCGVVFSCGCVDFVGKDWKMENGG